MKKRPLSVYEKKCRIQLEITIMVGDNLTADIEGAEAAGWNALWVLAGRRFETSK